MKQKKSVYAAILLIPLLAAAVIFCFITGLSNLRQSQADEGRRQLENALHRAAVTCYAVEGIYPPNLEYLQEHYGIQINETQYTVMYDAFASNLMPDITVLENES